MTLLLKFLIASMWGYVLHQTAPIFDLLPGGWGNLTRSGIGVLGAAPVFIAVENEFSHVEHRYTRLVLIYAASFLPMGFGVFVGYLIENWQRSQNE